MDPSASAPPGGVGGEGGAQGSAHARPLPRKRMSEPAVSGDEDHPHAGLRRLQHVTKTRVQPAIRMKELPMHRVRSCPTKERMDSNQLLLPTPRSVLQRMASARPEEDVERVRRETIDPFMRNRPRTGVARAVWYALPLVMGIILALVLVNYGVDRLSQDWTLDGRVLTNYDYSFGAFTWTMMNPSPEQSRPVMEAVTNTLAFMFGLLVTIIGVVLQFASEKITSHVTNLFFSDTVVLGCLGFVLINNCYTLWVYQECGYYHSPRFSVVLSVLLMNAQLIMLFPFLAYLYLYLDAEMVVTKLMTNGLNAFVQSINDPNADNEKNQVKATLSVEYLMDGALSSIKKKNKNVTSEILDAMCSFVMHYAALKDKAPSTWFHIPLWIRQSSDFLILSEDSVKEMVDRQTWVEWKVLRQYQGLFIEAIKLFKEMCYHICINTRIIGETAAQYGQYNTIDLVIKFYNTYLRTAINLMDVRVVYITLYQYRLLAETLLDRERGASKNLALRAVRIAKFMRYYAHICQTRNIFFLVETVAQDLRVLCEVAIHNALPEDKKSGKIGFNPTRVVFQQVHDKLLAILLSLNDFTGTTDAKRGVIRAQVILATYYLTESQVGQAKRIIKQLDREENRQLLMSIREEMCLSATKEFWEVSERGANFTYLEPRLRSRLDPFFAMFPWFAVAQTSEAWITFQNSAVGKQLRVQQELQNFDVEVADEVEDDGGEGDDDDDNSIAELDDADVIV
eukprot:m51a1_g9188 hypothetical protein (737) ;mRNA; r:72849-75341